MLAEGSRGEIVDDAADWCVQGPVAGSWPVFQGTEADTGHSDEKDPN